jgi:CRP-like cAMP-binding protein
MGRRATDGIIRAEPAGSAAIFDLDADLVQGLDSATASKARRVKFETWRLSPGVWDPSQSPSPQDRELGLLILEGLVISRTGVGRRGSVELLGAGDVLLPERESDRRSSLITVRECRVLEGARIAALGARHFRCLGSSPPLCAELLRRGQRRTHALAERLAIVQTPQLRTRLHLFLWSLEERWGPGEAEEITLPFRLSHQVIAECVAAQRTSVVAALQQLEADGTLRRDEDGRWIVGRPSSLARPH